MTVPGGRHVPGARPSRCWSRCTGVALAGVALAVAGCTLPELASPSPSPSPTALPTPLVTVAPPTPSPSPMPEPTPGRKAIPDIAAGEIAVTLIDGMRVRQRPGTDAPTVAGLLPLGAELGVVMGPFPEGNFGWYLVADADPDAPDFDEGWIAAGYEPDPFLRGTSRTPPDSPFLISMSGFGNAEEGPIQIGEGDHLIRWIAADPERIGCRFAVSLAAAGGEPIPTIRATVGAGIDRGTLQPQTFAALGVGGPAFVTVESDCDWALVVARSPNPATGSPSASPSP